MIRSKLGLKALLLSGLVLGLFAFAASGAQAEATAHWRVSGVNVNDTLLPQLKITGIENNTASLAFTTKGGTNVLILCTAANFDEGGKLALEGKITLGRILFTGCVTLLNEAISTKCKPSGGGAGAGEILTEKGEGLIVLDELAGGEKDDNVLIKPDTGVGTNFAVIHLGETCAIGETVEVKGELWLKDCLGNASFLEEKVTHLIEESLHGLTALGQPATIIGSANVALAGAHEGLKWSGQPG